MNEVLRIGSKKILFSLNAERIAALARALGAGPALLVLTLPVGSSSPHRMENDTAKRRLTVTGSDGEPILELLFTSTLSQFPPRLRELLKPS